MRSAVRAGGTRIGLWLNFLEFANRKGGKKGGERRCWGNRALSLRWETQLYHGFSVSLVISVWKKGFKRAVCVLLGISRLAWGGSGSSVKNSTESGSLSAPQGVISLLIILSSRNGELACSWRWEQKLTAVVWLCITEVHRSLALNLYFI